MGPFFIYGVKISYQNTVNVNLHFQTTKSRVFMTEKHLIKYLSNRDHGNTRYHRISVISLYKWQRGHIGCR
jgi:hypothetical protein